MTEEQFERIVLSFESIARALEGFNNEVRKAGNRYWPEPKPQRESVVSRVPTDEDRAKESLGVDNRSLTEWLDIGDTEEDDEVIGERTAQWLRDHPKETPKFGDASPEVATRGNKGRAGTKKAKDQA